MLADIAAAAARSEYLATYAAAWKYLDCTLLQRRLCYYNASHWQKLLLEIADWEPGRRTHRRLAESMEKCFSAGRVVPAS